MGNYKHIDIRAMASIVMMVGGAIVKAVAFSGSNYLFSRIGQGDVDKERKRHEESVEKLQAARIAWSKQRTERLDFLNQELQRQGHAVRTFQDVDEAMREYNMVTAPKQQVTPLPPEPKLEDFYTPSAGQKTRELVFIGVGMAATGLIAYTFLWNPFKAMTIVVMKTMAAYLVDAQKQHQQNTETFWVPSDDELRALKPGVA